MNMHSFREPYPTIAHPYALGIEEGHVGITGPVAAERPSDDVAMVPTDQGKEAWDEETIVAHASLGFG
jgi:hypothetical protein